MSPTNVTLIEAYLANIQYALSNANTTHIATLLENIQKMLSRPAQPSAIQLSVGVGLDTGLSRRGKPNEDFAFATTGQNIQTGETYGLFVVADGMGGHANGQLASRLAVETVVSIMLPYLQHEHVEASHLGNMLSKAVENANTVICSRNQGLSDQLDQMGTTVTAAVTFGAHAFIINVGDSRTYLYRPGVGLLQVTRDHSYVADAVADGQLDPEAVYTHPQRNRIYRCLGLDSFGVDVFYQQLGDGDILLLCSDGMWEMTRDEELERILSTNLSSEEMVQHLIHLAHQGGGHDNIGLVVSKCQMNIASMQTLIMPDSVATWTL